MEMTDTGERGLARAVADMGENETGQDKAEDMTWYDAATGAGWTSRCGQYCSCTANYEKGHWGWN